MKSPLAKKALNLFLILFTLAIFSGLILGIFFLIFEVFALMIPSERNNMFTTTSFPLQVYLFLSDFSIYFLGLVNLYGIRTFINNIADNLYFSSENLKTIQLIFRSTLAIFVFADVNSLLKLFGVNLHTNLAIGSLLTFNEGSFFYCLIALIIIFLVYLVFKRGIALQKDSNSII